MADETTLYFNGINAVTGDYELPPTSLQNIASVALGQPVDEKLQTELQVRHNFSGPKYGINADARNLAETGWGIIFAGKDRRAAAICDALKPLLDLRREQATKENEKFYQEYLGGDGYRPDDSHLDWLAREPRLMGPGSVDPNKVPYYLLLVGDPEQIPYRFQYQLDVQYAVGRLSFETLDEYAQYAQTVVEIESAKKIVLPKRAVFFGVRNPNDAATNLSADNLVLPLASEVTAKRPDWNTQTIADAGASKARLGQLLGGPDTPALMFTASHGMAFPNGNEHQISRQGALLCSDWPGPHDWTKPIPESFYLSAEDISSDARLAGLIAFFFACYGAGTPQFDDFARKALQQPESIAPRPFVARLPQRLLGHPKGSALAVVGHVERAWGYSFMWRDAGRQLKVFQDALDQLMKGFPIGAALEWFNERHAELSVALASEVENVTEWQKTRDDAKLAGLWTANNDARNYVVLGDPAVRLPVIEDASQPSQDRTITLSADTAKRLAGGLAAPPAPVLLTPSNTGADAAPEPSAPKQAAAFDMMSFSAQVEGERTSLTESIKNFTSQLAESLKKAADDISSLEVITYSTDDLSQVTYSYEDKKLHGELKMRALTRIAFDGDVQVCVPERDGHIDQAVWDVHLSMVKAAQENRAAFLQTMAEMATKLIGMLGGK
jgi:hypothetical protein